MAHINHAYVVESSGGTHDNTDTHRRGLNSLSPTFFIQPKTTGLVSLFIQVVLLIVSAITCMFFFYHVGGYEYTHWNENSTILEPINHNNPNQPNESSVMTTTPAGGASLVSTVSRGMSFQVPYWVNDSDLATVSLFFNSEVEPLTIFENASFGIEQVPLTTVMIADIQFDWLEVIRISTLVYMLICFIWFIAGLLFICTIRCENLDAAVFNTFVMILVVLYLCAHAMLVTSLIFLQREMSWRTMLITVGSIVVLFCCAFLGFVCISLNFGFIRYIDHMHGNRKCFICSLFCCGKSKEPAENGNASNGATTANVGEYENDVPLDRFDAF